jgi:hypothetical protein
MERRFRRCLLGAGFVAAALLPVPGASAPTFGDEDLKGEYLFTVLDISFYMPPGSTTSVVNHCVVAGTVAFDGAGNMALSATTRCSRSGVSTIGGNQYYSVNPDGSFLISESSDMSDPVHGQIVDKGRTLLLDGTTRTRPDSISWSGIGMKR